jgi:hypothetical protein
MLGFEGSEGEGAVFDLIAARVFAHSGWSDPGLCPVDRLAIVGVWGGRACGIGRSRSDDHGSRSGFLACDRFR